VVTRSAAFSSDSRHVREGVDYGKCHGESHAIHARAAG
jgi:hypothetical protein